MKKVIIFLGLSVLAFPFCTDAGVNLPFSTSALTCSDFTQTGSSEGPTGCDSVDAYGTWQCDSSHGMMINSSANYSGGEGGKGFRSWYGPAQNQGSATPQFTFSPRPTELWIRYYARWQPGVSWSGLNQKMLYMYLSSNVQGLFNLFTAGALFTAQNSNDSACSPLQCECYYNGTPRAYCPASEWKAPPGANSLGFSGNNSNGAFQLIEFHFKTNTSGSNGIFETWLNNVLVFSKTNINWGGGGVDRILFPSNNHALPSLSGCAYYDEDDFAFSTTGRIGPYSGAVNSPAPMPPSIQSIQ